MRIDKFAAEQTGISRADAKALIKRRQIIVNGSPVMSGDVHIDPENDEIIISGKHINYREHLYIMLNKPAGTVCAVKDELSPTVLELIPPELRRKGLFPAGRLDKDTEGFVFITDDGELAHRMLSPRSHVEKEYEVTLEKPAEDSYKELFASGMIIDGGEKCMPAEIIFTEDRHKVRLIICEGKYHQVKRMMEAVGNKVTFLRRIRIGGLPLDPNLPLGECREIMHKEVAQIYAKHKQKSV
ncbi:MAG: rRNA pseudouridine synthase [Oscillospiraceae bacterium]|nr:rRNA pseudouridine synthase [Oscillospiraceae bacterium]